MKKNLSMVVSIFFFFAVTPFLRASTKKLNVPICNFSILNISLGSPLWKKYGVKLDNFYSVYPKLDTNPSYAPTVYLLFDGENLGIRFFCPKKEKPVSTSSTRDFSLVGQDGFGVYLDTYNNKRSAYFISINVNNIQSDFYGDNAVESKDPSWDAEWYSKTRKLHNGWEGEIIIPIKILRFKNGVWGFNVIEAIKRIKGNPKVESISWVVPKSALVDPSTFGEIKLDVGKSSIKNHIELIPYFAGTYKPLEYKGGVDLEGVFHNNYNINLTYNPDFAQIEGDIDQINLSKTKLWLQEKRPFFMEKGDILNSMLQLMYTRIIEKIKYGGKITGNFRGADLYSFLVSAGNDSAKHILCFRAKKDFNKNWLGLYEVSKLEANYYNHSIEGDGGLKLPFNSNLDFALAKTFTRGLTNKNNLAYEFELKRTPLNKGLVYNLSYKELQENYNREVGFVSLPQIKSKDLYFYYIFPIDYFGIQHITPGISYDNWRNFSDNSLILDESNPFVWINFNRFLDLNFSLDKTLRLYNDMYFHNLIYLISANIVPSGIFKIYSFYMFGTYYSSNLEYPGISIFLTPLSNLSLDFSMDYFYTHNNDQNEKIKIFSLKENWNITKKLSFRSFLQWTDVSEEFQANFLLAYDFFVGSHIYLVWNEKRDISDFSYKNRYIPLENRTFFVKICYGFKI